MVYKPLLPVFQLAKDYRAREIKSPKGDPWAAMICNVYGITWGGRRGSPRRCPKPLVADGPGPYSAGFPLDSSRPNRSATRAASRARPKTS